MNMSFLGKVFLLRKILIVVKIKKIVHWNSRELNYFSEFFKGNVSSGKIIDTYKTKNENWNTPKKTNN